MFEELLPEGWGSAPLRELVDPSRRITYGIVQPGEWQELGKGVPLIRGQDYSSGEVAVENLRYVHENIASKYTRSTVREGDILLSIVGYVGLCAIVPKSAEGANITQTTARVSPSSNICSGYLAHYFGSSDFKEEVKKYTKGSAQPGLNLDDVEKMVVRKPYALGEQMIIARILDTLDTQIQKTEALIAKLEKVKEGLLHDLLTHGIDENGRLRPSPDQAPELYKESPLGLIPREWGSPLLDEISVRGSGHTPSRINPAFWNGDVGWVSLSDSKNLDNVWINNTAKKISKLGVANSSAVIHPAGTVVLSRDAGIGKSGVIRGEMAVSQHFMAWRCGGTLDNLFLYYWLQWMKPRFEAIALGSTIQTIGLRYFEGLRIPHPPRSEQNKISSILLRINERIWKERGAKNKAISEKVGLMDDLLTGRVRVTPLLEKAQTTTPA